MVDYIIQLSHNFIISYLDKVVNTKQDVIKIPYLSLRTIIDYLSYKGWKMSIKNRDNEIIELELQDKESNLWSINYNFTASETINIYVERRN